MRANVQKPLVYQAFVVVLEVTVNIVDNSKSLSSMRAGVFEPMMMSNSMGVFFLKKKKPDCNVRKLPFLDSVISSWLETDIVQQRL
jgi:hypothetical protein